MEALLFDGGQPWILNGLEREAMAQGVLPPVGQTHHAYVTRCPGRPGVLVSLLKPIAPMGFQGRHITNYNNLILKYAGICWRFQRCFFPPKTGMIVLRGIICPNITLF